MTRIIIAFLAVALFSAPTALAQNQDPMALQRCIWACLADFPGSDNPLYHQCVQQRCSDGFAPAPAQQPWTFGLAADDRTYFAGVALQDGSGRGPYYMCTPDGDSYFMLYGMPNPPGQFRIRIEGADYWFFFDRARSQLTTAMHRTNPIIGALASGRAIQVFDVQGGFVLQVSLYNARQAIGNAIGSCQR